MEVTVPYFSESPILTSPLQTGEGKQEPDLNFIIAVVGILVGVALLIFVALRSIFFRPNSNTERHSGSDRNTDHAVPIGSALPMFCFNTIIGGHISADCALCHCTFEPNDQLRLIPSCGHACHSNCLLDWLEANTTCPLCATTIYVAEYSRIQRFTVGLGNVYCRRRSNCSSGYGRRSYLMGVYEYVIEEEREVVVHFT
ncbi:hypothetical protein IFM89_004817 [Coptis chinensis]|uniref:RING-type domain-containing protein n=1 Tax=Coptis chinensis TaxID=261450 RepID=A0A835IU88_9MAGN|nr:hypothetical protein IFM89_004817 [Coptis chinensis]